MTTSSANSTATAVEPGGLVNPLPDRPRVVLRIGFAGQRDLPEGFEKHLGPTLEAVLKIIGRQLAVTIPAGPVQSEKEPPIAAFFAKESPLLRLITGLCEGADATAAEVREQISGDRELTGGSSACNRVETELAAVLPFDFPTYRKTRPSTFQEKFDATAKSCAYILTADGLYDKQNPDTHLAKARRAKAYRTQSTLLLRHSDMLIAATDPDAPRKAGGTMETVQAALTFDLPVVFIHTAYGKAWLLQPGDEIHSVLAQDAPTAAAFSDSLVTTVQKIVADPNITTHKALLDEYFDEPSVPPLRWDGTQGKEGAIVRALSEREKFWNAIEARFATGCKPRGDAPVAPFKPYRDRASALNRHYAGLYRGAFSVNYMLAVSAVLLAALSLTLLAVTHHSEHGALPRDLIGKLLFLGFTKFLIVAFIAYNTRQAKNEKWNESAVDYRYLSERLRALYYLPLAGSFQPPPVVPPHYATRAVRQSTVDWLFNAIVRSVSPASLATTQSETIDTGSGSLAVKINRLEPEKAAVAVRDGWVKDQVFYHERNTRTMGRIHRSIQHVGAALSYSIIFIVLADIVALIIEFLHAPEHWVHFASSAAPWLLFLAAVLPAAVAALNGIGFQSECYRLAERSALLRVILGGRPPGPPKTSVSWPTLAWCRGVTLVRHAFRCAPDEEAPVLTDGHWGEADALLRRIAVSKQNESTNVAAWSADVLRLTEGIADDLAREASDWSVLYTKEIPET